MASENLLIWFLRVTALMFLAAAPAVVMPADWMDAIGQWLGLTALPEAPLVGYLARHLSAIYVALGASFGYLSCDVRRYLPLLHFMVPMASLLSATIVAIDIAVGMPWSWTVGEAASMFAWVAVFWWLVRRTKIAIFRSHI